MQSNRPRIRRINADQISENPPHPRHLWSILPKTVGSTNPNKSSFVKGFTLTPQERREVIAFLKALTDEKFLTDQRFSDPWKESPAETNRRPP